TRLRHLQQREQCLLHTRTAARREAHQRGAILDALVDRALEALADHRTHRAAEELEFESTGDDRQRLERAGDRDQRVALTRGLLRGREPVAVPLAVAELERILRRNLGADLFLVALVEETREALASADAHVMAAFRTDIEIALELGAIQHGVTGGALDPQSFRHRARAALGLDPRRHDFFEPRHSWRNPYSRERPIIADCTPGIGTGGAPAAGSPNSGGYRTNSR